MFERFKDKKKIVSLVVIGLFFIFLVKTDIVSAQSPSDPGSAVRIMTEIEDATKINNILEIETARAQGKAEIDKDGNNVPDYKEGNLVERAVSYMGDSVVNGLKEVLGWNWVQDILHYIPYIIFQVTSGIMVLIAKLFDLVINQTVINFVSRSGLGENDSVIKAGWIVIRDFCNITFIFVILWMAIQLVLNKDSEFKRLIAPLIISALLINFSYLFAGFAIDVSNKLTTTIYTSTLSNQEEGQGSYNIGTVILAQFKVQSFFAPQESGAPATGNPFGASFEAVKNNTSIFGLIVMIIITIVISAVLLGNCLAFIYRFLILVFGLLLSPLIFIAAFLPQLKKTTDGWKNTFIGELIFAPVFFVLLAISIKTMQSTQFQELIGPASFKNLRFGQMVDASIPALLNVSVIIAFLIGTLLVSKSLGVAGSSSADGAYKWLKKSGMGVIGGVVGGVARNTVGRGAQWLGKGYDNAAAGIGKTVGDTKLFGKLGGPKLGTLANVATLGALKEAGYATRGALKSTEESKFGSSMSLGDYEKRDEKRAQELSDIRNKKEQERTVKAAVGEDMSKVDWDKEDDVIVNAHKTIQKMTSNQIAGLGKDVLTKGNIAAALSENVIKDLEKHDDFKDKPDLIREIKEAKISGLKSILDKGDERSIKKIIATSDFAKLVGKITKKGEKEKEDKSAERIAQLTKFMTNNQLRSIAKENDNNEKLLNGIRDAIVTANTLGTATPTQKGNHAWLTKGDGKYLYNLQTTEPGERSTADEL